MGIVLMFHSLVRFVVLLAAFAGIVKTLFVLAHKAPPDKLDRVLASAFVGLYDLQVLLGLLVILLGGLQDALHPIVMFVGALVAHGLQMATRRSETDQARWMRLLLYVVPLVIILIGLAVVDALPV